MARVTFRPPTDADCIALAATLRQADREELAASSGRAPLEALRHSVHNSTHAVAAIDSDGSVICIFGCGLVGLMEEEGVAWLLGSDLVDRYWRLFARLSVRYLASMHDIYPVLVNAVDGRQRRTVRWLKFLGATFGDPVPMPGSGVGFVPFRLEKRDV